MSRFSYKQNTSTNNFFSLIRTPGLLSQFALELSLLYREACQTSALNNNLNFGLPFCTPNPPHGSLSDLLNHSDSDESVISSGPPLGSEVSLLIGIPPLGHTRYSIASSSTPTSATNSATTWHEIQPYFSLVRLELGSRIGDYNHCLAKFTELFGKNCPGQKSTSGFSKGKTENSVRKIKELQKSKPFEISLEAIRVKLTLVAVSQLSTARSHKYHCQPPEVFTNPA